MTHTIKKNSKVLPTNMDYSVRSEERLDALSDKFLGQVVKYGRMYCPCQNVRNEDSICPCRYMRSYSVCRCGLFTKGEPNGNQKENS